MITDVLSDTMIKRDTPYLWETSTAFHRDTKLYMEKISGNGIDSNYHIISYWR